MTRYDVVEMAQEVGFFQDDAIYYKAELKRFAELIAAECEKKWHKIIHDECEAAIKEEREACCSLLEGMHEGAKHSHNHYLYAAIEVRRFREGK